MNRKMSIIFISFLHDKKGRKEKWLTKTVCVEPLIFLVTNHQSNQESKYHYHLQSGWTRQSCSRISRVQTDKNKTEWNIVCHQLDHECHHNDMSLSIHCEKVRDFYVAFMQVLSVGDNHLFLWDWVGVTPRLDRKSSTLLSLFLWWRQIKRRHQEDSPFQCPFLCAFFIWSTLLVITILE